MFGYAALPELMSEEKAHRKDRDVVRDAEYSLYAFVLCDHNDDEFRENIAHVFSDLDRHTGENLLFTSLIKSDIAVRFRLEKDYPLEVMPGGQCAIDDNLYQHALLEAFQISLSDLPAIVLTTSLESDHWYVIRVADVYQCMHWLEVLRGYADDMADNIPVSIEDVLNRRVSQSTCSGSWYFVEGAPICDLVEVVKAAVNMSVRGSDEARWAFAEVCERLKDGIMCSWGDDDANEKNGAIVRLVKYLEVISKPSRPCRARQSECDDILMAPRDMFEPDTVRYIDIFEELHGNRVIRDMDDYTVLCSLLHKIFESEINASVLQLMRKNIDIPMPEFYDKFYPDSKECYVRRAKMKEAINLNRYLKGEPVKYVSPGLGKVLLAFQILSEDSSSFRDDMQGFGIDESSRVEFSALWDSICSIRNREAHCQVITWPQYHCLLEAVSHVIKYYLSSLIEMKQSLRYR